MQKSLFVARSALDESSRAKNRRRKIGRGLGVQVQVSQVDKKRAGKGRRAGVLT
jgi:hypothetical protein